MFHKESTSILAYGEKVTIRHDWKSYDLDNFSSVCHWIVRALPGRSVVADQGGIAVRSRDERFAQRFSFQISRSADAANRPQD